MLRNRFLDYNDQLQIRSFLQEVYLLNARREYCWPLYRWDYWCWHVNANIHHFDLSAAVFLWRNEHNNLVGVLNPDNPGEAFLQVHPGARSSTLEVEMIAAAENLYALTQPNGQQKLTVWCQAGDHMREDILTRRGYTRQDWPEYQRRRERAQPVVDVPLAAGYKIRALGGDDELPARSWASWKAFHPNEPDERYEGWEWYRNVQRAPLYRRELDLVVIAPQGEIAAFCTLWFDPATASAAFEPVGTHPVHQRRGLGKALLTEGLRRVHELGATLVTVGSYSEPAGALYASVGFNKYDLNIPWQKLW